MYFHYNNYTPGEKVEDQLELQNEVFEIISKKTDSYNHHREQILDKVYSYHDDNSSSR